MVEISFSTLNYLFVLVKKFFKKNRGQAKKFGGQKLRKVEKKVSIFFNFFKKSPVENFPPPIPHDIFCGMSRPNIPLSKYEIKKRGKIDRSRSINWFYWKNVFFSNFRAFWPPGNKGRGVKNLKMSFLTFLYHMWAGLTI